MNTTAQERLLPPVTIARRFRSGKALGAGLSFRPLAETVRDTLEWDKGRAAVTLQAGLSSEREQEMLAVWHGAPRA